MRCVAIVFCLLAFGGTLVAQHDHDHGHGEAAAKPVERPRVFLDKSPRIVAYQLKRLNNERLLLVERKSDDAKYLPVHKAILLRDGMSPQYREEAVAALVELATLAGEPTTPARVIVDAVSTLDPDDRQQKRTAYELATMIFSLERKALTADRSWFRGWSTEDHSIVRSIGYLGRLKVGTEVVDVEALEEDQLVALLDALSMVKDRGLRLKMRDRHIARGGLLKHESVAVRRAAITALGDIKAREGFPSENFVKIAPFVSDDRLRPAAVRGLLKIPDEGRDPEISTELVKEMVTVAESLPVEARTSSDFINMAQLTYELFTRVPPEVSREYRRRLSEVSVRIVQIHTVEEEMRYDIPYFAVEAGKSVQVVLKNEDLMPHNLVIVTDGSLQEVAELGLAVGPNNGHEGKQYVPKSEKVLFATNMVPPGKEERLTFTAPTEPGTYPYVCTFPRHWMRMYGVMLVVDDLDTWLENPVAPPDPLGSTRSFVQSWTIEDFRDTLANNSLANNSLAEEASPDLAAFDGKKLFTEATCAQCHKADGVGGAVGPALNGVLSRWKGDRLAVLREILEPSHRIDAKYAVHVVLTEDGDTVSGIVAAEDKKTVSILANPESKELTVVKKDIIEEMVKTSTSMMPKGLLDRYTREEVLSLLGYVGSLQQE